MDRSALNSPIVKVLALILFVGAFLVYALWPRHLPPPDESRRLAHPEDAYSIIAPPHWTRSFETKENTLTNDKGWLKIEPLNPGKLPPSVMIHVLKDPDVDALKHDGFVDGTFHGKPALTKAFKQGKFWGYSIDFQDHGEWFDMCLMTPDYVDVPKSRWWAYLDSFRYEPEKATKPAVATTLPELKFSTTLPTQP